MCAFRMSILGDLLHVGCDVAGATIKSSNCGALAIPNGLKRFVAAAVRRGSSLKKIFLLRSGMFSPIGVDRRPCWG